MDFPILTFIIFTPAVGAALTLLVPARRPEIAKAVGYMATAATAGFAAYMLWSFETGKAGLQFVEHHSWFGDTGVSYLVGVDGISVFMVALTALVFPLGLLASARLQVRVKAYTFWFLVLETAIMGIFLAVDLIAFFIFWELLLVPMYFIIAGWGHERRVYAAMKFFLYTMAGSAFLLASILALGFLHQSATGNLTFDFRTLMEWDGLSGSTETWLFFGFMISFAIKAPLFPFHTWLPDVHTEAPTFGSVVLAGVLLKMGAYGFLRFSFTLFPQASVDWAWLLLVLSVIGIFYGSIIAARQKDLKRLIAYSSIAHMGFLVLGIFTLTTTGLDGALVIMISHALTTGALFLLVGFLDERTHTRIMSELKGIWKAAPILGGLFLFATFAGIGVPGLSGFVGEFLSLLATFVVHRWYAVLAAFGVVLGAVYMLYAFQQSFTGIPKGVTEKLRDLNAREVVVVAPLLLLSVFIGLYPKPIIDRVEPTMKALIAHFEERTDYREPKQTGDEAERPRREGAPVGEPREHEGGHGSEEGP
jgi:NADH-quinone oxidoreductase subunit M